MRARGDGYGYLRLIAAVGISILWAALLAGCAAVHPRHVPPVAPETVEVREIPVYIVHDLGVYTHAFGPRINAWGVTTGTNSGGAYLVELDDSMPQYGYVAPMVAAHELGHVLGIDDHDPKCPWMQPGMPTNTPLVDKPCEATIIKARARSAGMRYVLRLFPTTDPAFVEAVRWAVSRWNAVLGRNALSMRIGYAPATTPESPLPRILPPVNAPPSGSR